MRKRHAFTIIEMVAAFGLLAVALVMIAKIGYASMKERGRAVARQTALEHLHNILETARARPWDKLTPEWAAGLKVPHEFVYILPQSKLTVTVESENTSSNVKRVTAVLHWQGLEGYPLEERLVGFFAARSATTREEMP